LSFLNRGVIVQPSRGGLSVRPIEFDASRAFGGECQFFTKVGGGNFAIFASSWAARSAVHSFCRNA
jgi:hypothetical protein